MGVRVLLLATDVRQFNGYSAIAYEFAKELAKKKDIELTYFGFQNFHNNQAHQVARKLPENVQVYDACANENPKSLGFGFTEILDFIKINKPDVIIIYNDMVVVSNFLNQLKTVQDRKFKIIVYMDQVYLCQKKEAIQLLNENADFVLTFTPFWEMNAKRIGVKLPTDFVRHGFNPEIYYPVPKKLARMNFNLSKDDFIVLNLNRNQPRKRWDLTIMAWAIFVSRHLEDPVKLLIGTAVQGAWNLIEIYEKELGYLNITLEQGMKHLIMLDNPQQLTDEDINILYNACDVGINTCDGSGFELTSFQHAAVGKGQIAPNIGGCKDYILKDHALVIEPKFNLYIDSGRDGVGGKSEICDHVDFADAIEYYYANPDLAEEHGKKSREYILKTYRYEDIGEKLYDIIKKLVGAPDAIDDIDDDSATMSLKDINQLEHEIEEKPQKKKLSPTELQELKKNNIKLRLQKKLKNKRDGLTPEQQRIQELEAKVNELLASKK